MKEADEFVNAINNLEPTTDSVGSKFQEYISELFNFTLYRTRDQQYFTGETLERYEIKYDRKYKTTGNLFIEQYEKRNSYNKKWIPSGINRNDNTLYYLIGDEEQVWIFDKTYLKELIKDLPLLSGSVDKENRSATSKGCKLPITYIKINEQVRIINIKEIIEFIK